MRPVDAQQRDGTIFRRCQFLTDQAIADKGCTGEKQGDEHNHERRRQAEMQRLLVKRSKSTTDPAQEKRAVAAILAIAFLEKAGGEHRAKRQRHHGRQKHRNRQNEAEFAEQTARLPRQE